ncbi:putative TIR domain, P-loop containing nucleoside triphosphate hydrolase [Helianthus debilis subsp. tardiflorus]
MASSSSTGVMASSSSSAAAAAEACIYDVFLSFRGEDTRHSFTDHLYHRLKRAGIHTFRDDEELPRGQELKPEIERAIKASKASIVVLSENYATSTWCLDELLLILKQRRECNHFVLPVFCHVEPTNVRNQTGSFALEVKPSSRWTYHNVDLWKRALMEVANLSGFTLSGHETGILKKVVDTIYNKLGPKDVHLPINITGMSTRYEEITSWLDQSNLEFLAIYGMGGSGKSTLAKYIYDSNQKSFEYVSFIENIGSRSKGTNYLLKLQEKLIKDIYGGKKRKIPAVSRGTCMVEALQMKRALIVLDDVVGQSQLDTLLGTSGKINPQSKIIITSREKLELPCWRCQKYEMKLLNDDESLELLCRHAFRSKIPMAGFEELVLQAIQYCEGNPLALEVLGSSMSNNTTINYWRSQLNLLEKDIHSGIQSVLIRSYMALPYNTQKELFLHIACFFIGKDVDYVIEILEPDYSAISGIQTLVNRCLLSVSPNKKLMMHRLLQEMGKNIVRQESTKFPAKRSRVWLSNDSYKILSKGEGSEKIEGLALDMKMLSKENSALKSSYLKTDTFKKMVNLKLLQLNFAEFKGSYKHVSEELRWLCWLGFHIKIVPADLCMGNLVAVDMSYSNLEVFEPPTVDILSLKIINLKDSHNLIEIRNITRIPNLETDSVINSHHY